MTLSKSASPAGLEDAPPLPAPAFQVGSFRLSAGPYLIIRSQLERASFFFGGGAGNGAVLCSKWDLSSLTHTLCIGSAES